MPIRSVVVDQTLGILAYFPLSISMVKYYVSVYSLYQKKKEKDTEYSLIQHNIQVDLCLGEKDNIYNTTLPENITHI